MCDRERVAEIVRGLKNDAGAYMSLRRIGAGQVSQTSLDVADRWPDLFEPMGKPTPLGRAVANYLESEANR